MHVRGLDENENELEDEARYKPDPDPVSVAVGAVGFVSRHVLDECHEQFPGSTISRFPEMFDRFYWEPQRVLIDILEDGNAEQLSEERERKRCEFKEAWCSEHGWRYLALSATDAQDPQRVRELLHGLRQSEEAPSFQRGGIVPTTQRPARGKLHRPKAS
jgi:hypothetical protein